MERHPSAQHPAVGMQYEAENVRLLLPFTVGLHAIEHVILCIKPLQFYFVLISVAIRIKYDVLQEWYFFVFLI